MYVFAFQGSTEVLLPNEHGVLCSGENIQEISTLFKKIGNQACSGLVFVCSSECTDEIFKNFLYEPLECSFLQTE